MTNLTNTTSADRETVTTMTKAISTLTDQLAAKDIWAKFKEAEIKCLLGGRAQHVAATAAGPASA
jgi:ribosomal protein L12E/L44/L45/RPP1/RPP2